MKTKLIIAGIAAAFLLMLVGAFASANNRAISLEEQVGESNSSIEVQEKRRVDLINNLVDTVESYANYESETMTAVIAARAQASKGNIEEAQIALTAVAEAYPELKANENYQQLMTELATTENLIAEHRNAFNIQVKNYNKYVRAFPASLMLNLVGYEKKDFTYAEYNAPSDAPQNLFEDK